MTKPKTITKSAKKEFWQVVETCLIEFHEWKAIGIRSKMQGLIRRVEEYSPGRIELFYHTEPFDAACLFANHPLKLDDYLDRYLEIRDRTPEKQIKTGVR